MSLIVYCYCFFQRQRLRQLILKQQKEKSAIRQEKGLQEATATSAPGTSRLWSQNDSVAQNDSFGRPPPPYPGNVSSSPVHTGQRFPGAFLGDKRGPSPEELHCPRPSFPRDLNNMAVRPPGQR